MSRWLKSVNTLLEKLDGQVEHVVEERAQDQQEDGGQLDEIGGSIQDILNKRGLSESKEEEEDDDEVGAVDGPMTADDDSPLPSQAEANDATAAAAVVQETATAPEQEAEMVNPAAEQEENKPAESSNSLGMESGEVESNEVVATDTSGVESEAAADGKNSSRNLGTTEAQEEENKVEASTNQQGEVRASESDDKKDGTEPSGNTEVTTNVANKKSSTAETPTPAKAATPAIAAPSIITSAVTTSNSNNQAASSAPVYQRMSPRAAEELRQAHKESRTLKRHVVALNSQLEAAEAELKAQRAELERAADRMEKDRVRNKEEKEKEKTRHEKEMKALKTQNEQAMKEQKKRYEHQLDESRKQLKQLEERRMQDSGDWNKELTGAVEREQEMGRKLVLLEDEKSTLLSQISTLQSQQAALGNRLESLTQTSENAMAREREAEDRLDAALSLHARQLSQRQAREAELERTIAEIGAALVVARNKENRLLREKGVGESNKDGSGGKRRDSESLAARLDTAEEDLETVRAQLGLEQEKTQALQQELRDMAKERTEEATAARVKQMQYDREVADMTITISRLQSNLSKKDSMDDGPRRSSSASTGETQSKLDKEETNQIKSLSEEVLRQRERVSSCNSEIATLKSRLKAALERATVAEQRAELMAEAEQSRDVYDVMERSPMGDGAPPSGGFASGSSRRRKNAKKETYSIRSAMKLNPGVGEGKERIGKAIDTIDQFSVSTGRYLRYNPLARGAFLVYLLALHMWTFTLLVFHAHSFEAVHGDFGAGRELPHGPHALMQQLKTQPAAEIPLGTSKPAEAVAP